MESTAVFPAVAAAGEETAQLGKDGIDDKGKHGETKHLFWILPEQFAGCPEERCENTAAEHIHIRKKEGGKLMVIEDKDSKGEKDNSGKAENHRGIQPLFFGEKGVEGGDHQRCDDGHDGIPGDGVAEEGKAGILNVKHKGSFPEGRS